MKWVTWLRAEWDRVAGFGLVVVGALFVLLGYLGVRNSPFVAEQMAYIASGGIGGLFCLGLGVGLLLTADLHDEWRKLDRLEVELRGVIAPEREPDEPKAEREEVPVPGEPSGGPVSNNGRHGREPVPQATGAAGALAIALTRPAGGTRQALGVVSLVLLLPLVTVGAGWRRAAQTADMDVAARGLGLAVGAVTVAFAVIALWALWMRVGVLRRRADVTDRLRRWNLHRFAARSAGRARPDRDDTAVFVAAGHRRFHRAGCPMLDFVGATAVPPERLPADLSPCGLCDTP